MVAVCVVWVATQVGTMNPLSPHDVKECAPCGELPTQREL